MTSGKAMRWGAISLIAAAGIAVLATTAMPRAPERPESLEVVLSDASTRKGAECDPAVYAETFFDGTQVEISDGAGTVLTSATVSEPVTSGQRGCAWTVTFDSLPQSETYVLTLRNENSPNREHAYTYTAAELAEDSSLWVAVVR
ncbi:hypothetical protein ATJ97_3886 [Georgenia soli]|uniref:Uncharacterized protein n=1 Tax=Georgenia soli TaxID=638953 RepID=A0A2A9EQU1_9MICO|nr:hypothetical protein [Georgenia soli]PFG41334.1 hypothetical protein ATJ97_3886 [Georgenia soli]